MAIAKGKIPKATGRKGFWARRDLQIEEREGGWEGP